MNSIYRIFLVFIILSGSGAAFGQGHIGADAILGDWLTENGDFTVNIYLEKGLYYGKVVRVNNPERKSAWKTGTVVLRKLQYDTKKECWHKGKLFIKDNFTIGVKLALTGAETMKVTGKKFLIKLTKVWKRIQKKKGNEGVSHYDM